ncbi:MAG: response regulator [Cyanobacteriota bacterium]
MYNLAVLDDNSGFCQVLQCFLSNYFEVSTFTDTKKFLENIKFTNYDLVLVDLSIIPDSSLKINNGCELIEYLKNILKNPPLLVLFTGWISRNPLEEGRQICPLADGFLAKDSGIEEILLQINRLLASKAS